MANRNNQDYSADKPNVSQMRAKTFQRSRLYLQLITILAIALAFSLGVSIFFKVENITVSGTNRYSAWTVAEASGIQKGDNLLFFGRAGAQVRIKQALNYVENVRIGIKLPGTVNIFIEEVPVVYSVKDHDGNWWIMTSDGKLLEKANGAEAGNHTVIEGVVLNDPAEGEQATAWEAPPELDTEGNPIPSATTNADRLKAALLIAQQLERNEILGEAASICVESLQQLKVQYGSRYEVRLGDVSEMDGKIAAMKSAIAQMGEFQTGILEVSNTDGKWQVVYRQG
jgi:cell division protein FtsQ